MIHSALFEVNMVLCVERGSSASLSLVVMSDSQSREPEFESPTLLGRFRSLYDAQLTQC